MTKDRIRRRWAATGAALLAAALSSPAAGQDGEDAERDAPSAARSCLPHPTIKRTKILDGRNIVFVTRDDTIYNNQLPRQCPSLKRGSLVNYPVEHGRVCAGDNFQLLWETSPRNYVPAFVCKLGLFVPITESELADLTAMTEESRERRPRRRSVREAVTTEQVELPPTEAAPAPTGGEAPPSE
jgi:hypothetical protein